MRITFQDIYEDYDILSSLGEVEYYNNTYPQIIRASNKIYKKVIKKMLNFKEETLFKTRRDNTIFMLNADRFDYLADALTENFDIITFGGMGNKSKVNCLHYYPVNYKIKLFDGFIRKDLSPAYEVIDDMSRFFLKHRIKAVILSCDRLFTERALVFAARKIHVPVIVYQHGSFILDDIAKNKIGAYADEYWVWSESVKDKFIKDISSDIRVRVMGYPFRTVKWENPNNNRILFVGEFYNDKESLVNFSEVARNVSVACTRIGKKFVYRLHPSESKKDILLRYKDLDNFSISDNKGLIDDIKQSEMIIGDISTVLMEATINGCPVLRVIWNKQIKELAGNGMYAYGYNVENNCDEIETGISTILSRRNNESLLNDYYIHINNSFRDDVNEWIGELIKES